MLKKANLNKFYLLLFSLIRNFVAMKKIMALLLMFVLAFWMPIHAQNGMIVQHYTHPKVPALACR